MTMQLFGGPMTMLAGDEYAEGEKLRFKSKGGIATAWQLRQGTLPAANVNLASWVGVAGRLRTTHPALRGRGRERLRAREGDDRLLLAAARVPDDTAVVPLLVFNNLNRHDWTTARYDVGARVRERLDPEAFYQVRDRVGFRSGSPVVATRARRGRDCRPGLVGGPAALPDPGAGTRQGGRAGLAHRLDD